MPMGPGTLCNHHPTAAPCTTRSFYLRLTYRSRKWSLRHSKQRPRLQCRAAAVADVPTWHTIAADAQSDEILKSFVVRPGQQPGTAPHPTLKTEKDAHLKSTKPVVLFRDTNAWCPFCQRVWMALLEKGIDFDVVLIALYNKPDWYEEVVPTRLVPAAYIKGKMVWESLDILKALDEAFPERPLFPTDADRAEEAATLAAASEELSAAGYKFLTGREGGFGPGETNESQLPAYKAAFEQQLQKLEAALDRTKGGGPWILGEFSYMDLMYVIHLERFAANLPLARGFALRDNPQYPQLAAWFQALDARPSYQQVRSDDATHHLIMGKLFPHIGTAPPPPPDATQQARREAAAKLNVNREIIVKDCATRSGCFTATRGINGYPAEPTLEVRAAVDYSLRRMAHYLLTGTTGPKHPEAAGRAVGAATLAYFRNRASAPRDMTAAAAAEMRNACDHVLADSY